MYTDIKGAKEHVAATDIKFNTYSSEKSQIMFEYLEIKYFPLDLAKIK